MNVNKAITQRIMEPLARGTIPSTENGSSLK